MPGAKGSVAVVACARPAERELDAESADWLRRLSGGDRLRHEGEVELHARLVRIARAEVSRRSAGTPVNGPELTDLAYQAADDAMLATLAKLAGFRSESRFMTWAYRFVILEVPASSDATTCATRRSRSTPGSGSCWRTGSGSTRRDRRRRRPSWPRCGGSSTRS